MQSSGKISFLFDRFYYNTSSITQKNYVKDNESMAANTRHFTLNSMRMKLFGIKSTRRRREKSVKFSCFILSLTSAASATAGAHDSHFIQWKANTQCCIGRCCAGEILNCTQLTPYMISKSSDTKKRFPLIPFPFFALSRRRLSCYSVLLVFLFLIFFTQHVHGKTHSTERIGIERSNLARFFSML